MTSSEALAVAMTDIVTYGDQRAAEADAAARASLKPQIDSLNLQVAGLAQQLWYYTRPPILVGARVTDIPWAQAASEIGPIAVTRLFYRKLPTKFTRQGIPDGVRLIISFKDPVTNVKSYVSSIPAGADVQMGYHHEAENDYGPDGGEQYLSEFATARSNVKAGNPDMPVVKIAGGYQYGTAKRHGWDGSYVPDDADRYYMDSYQRGPVLTPAEQTPQLRRYLALLEERGKNFHGFTEYGRGAIPFGGTVDPAVPGAREILFPIDAVYLRSLPDVQVWCYWYTIDGANPQNPTPDQWRLTDTRSQAAWRSLAQ